MTPPAKSLFVLLLAALGAGCGVAIRLPAPTQAIASAALTATPMPTATSQPTATATPAPTPMGQGSLWQLRFSDEFDGAALDAGKWVTCYWWGAEGCTIASNRELEWYQPDDVLVSGGVLRLRAQERRAIMADGKVYEYTSGMITSGRDTSDTTLPPRFAFQYGYVEMRARIPRGPGLWPAFWMLPADHDSKPEIDVLEILGHQPNAVHMALHFRLPNGDAEHVSHTWIGPDFSMGWHVFAVDWRPEALVWYLDGRECWRYTEAAHLPHEPMYLLANLAVGGDWPGAPDSSTTFPSYYEIDYVRVWQRIE